MNEFSDTDQKVDYKKEFRERFWLKLLGSPYFVAPFLAGCSGLMANWALDLHSGVAVFAGLSAMLVSCGILLTRFFAGAEDIGQEVATDISMDIEQSRKIELDELEKALVEDGDPRTEGALRDLRKLSAAFSAEALWPQDVNFASRDEIMANVSRLFSSCVLLLRKSLELWHVASGINIKAAKEPIMQRRETMLKDVADGLRRLGSVLAGLHEISALDSGEEQQVRSLSRELEDSLRVAKAAEKRMAGIEKEIGARMRD